MREDRRVITPHESGRAGRPVRLIVLHADASPRESSTIHWLQHRDAQVSYHVLIHRDGTSTRFVDDSRNAWHAGKSAWGGVSGVNRISLGLAFGNRQDGTEPLTPEQLETARAWIGHWRAIHPIEEVVTHSMVSPRRKFDPERAPNFDLAALCA